MCGILGYVGDFGAERLAAGLARIAHRGPDDAGTWFDDDRRVGLGHARLSILDLSPLGHQPMSDPDGRVVIAYNGEIYNFRELRAELETRGHRFRSRSDTEVLLHLYLEEGEAFLERLNGIFAFALWDARSRTLLLARDALGVKPLYVCAGPLGVAFASEIKGLLELVPDARALDVASLHRYLTFLWCPGEGTPLRDVRKLAPGEVVRVRDGRIEGRRTWYRLPAFAGRAADLDEPDAVAGSLAQLRAAVHRQMVADVPVGAFLSGGLDSSAVVALAREVHPEIRCFTIEIEGGQEAGTADDLPYATRVAKHLGVSLERVRIDAGRMADDLEFMVAQLDEPLADPAPLNVFYISRLAREHGMKVLLSGAGGDDLFTGYRRHVALRYESAWTWLPRGARAALDRMASRLDQRNPWFRRAAKLFRDAHLDGDDRLVGAFAWARDAELRSLWTPDAAREIDGTRAGEPMLEFLRPMPASVPDLERMLALEQRFFLADHNLIYTDKMSMATGVEVRVPFLDLELVEFAARIPPGLKQRGRIGKWVLKRAMEPMLPRDVVYRPKSGFGAPLRRWMRRDLREMVGDLLGPDSLRRRGLFDPDAVARLLSANDEGKVDVSYTLLGVLGVEMWCRAYLDGRGSRSPG